MASSPGEPRSVRTALSNGRALIDGALVTGRTIVIEGPRIAAVVPDGHPDAADAGRHDLGGRLLLPGFVDIQVNGGGGVLFNDAPTVDGIRAIGTAHRRFGTTGFLPTLISDGLDVVARAIAAVDAAIAAGVPGVLGIHLEGPFISQERRGAHDPAKLRRLDDSAVGLLTSLTRGTTHVTLAPEVTTPEIIRTLVSAGVVVSAGHTNATFDVVQRGFAAGVTGVTHLFNAMSPLATRAPGTVGAALTDSRCRCGVIVDGRHVDPRTLTLALRCKALDRFMLVTDGMPSVGAADKSFQLYGRRIEVRDGVCVDESGTLSGSDLDMASAVRNAVGMLGVDVVEAVRMASEYPAAFLGLGAEIGRIAAGHRASLLTADDQMQVHETWIDGQRQGGE